MAYLNSLMEQLRPVARTVLPSDPLRSVHLTNTNRYTRIYLHRIIQRARRSPFNLLITDLQLARLFRVSLRRFRQWFHQDIRFAKVFRRARYLLREMIRTNILEDRGELEEEEDANISENPIRWPDESDMTMYRARARAIREDDPILQPVITDPREAEELIGWILDAHRSLSSISNNSDRTDFGVQPNEENQVEEWSNRSLESFVLNGPPCILTEQELHDQFKRLCVDDMSSDDEVFL